IKPIVTCEIEAYAIALNIKRMESGEVEAHPIWSNLKTFPVECIPKGSIDLLTGGFPCQPFSAAGKRRASEDPRHLWPYITRIIDAIKPVRCFFENVEGLVSAKTCEHLEEIQRVDDLISAERNPRTRWALSSWRERFYRRLLKTDSISALHLVLCQLEELGYRTTWGIFSAEEVGAPHRRKRVFILADSRGQRLEECVRIEGKSGQEEKSQQGEAAPGVYEISNGRWPSRPGQPQYGWEPPRVVADAPCKLHDGSGEQWTTRGVEHTDCGGELADPGSAKPEGLPQSEERYKNSKAGESSWYGKIKSGLGRIIAGIAHRIDRLRMLGNGVVPQTAARAWEVLNKRMNSAR
ncbi:MAG: DNA cytosine methyltransferase, partial [Deltaproteobacteria bacterium]|nr:DNA cytosine methyltransferase [Deltaproteobacteria bacterium]